MISVYNRLSFSRFPVAYQVLFKALKAGSLIQTFPGYEIGGDKAIFSYVPELIRHYLKETPILKQPKTIICKNSLFKEWDMHNESFVIKQRCGYGGQQVFFWREMGEEEKIELVKKIESSNYEYVIQQEIDADKQRILNPQSGKMEKAIYDMRIFCVGNSFENCRVMPGGMCRNVFGNDKKVNISRQGVVRDIWVIN